MKDFRARVIKKAPNTADIKRFLDEGRLAVGLRNARSVGFEISQHDIDAVAMRMFRAGKIGELLSLSRIPDLHLPIDVRTLLRECFDLRDYHTFLKQVHRLGLADLFQR